LNHISGAICQSASSFERIADSAHAEHPAAGSLQLVLPSDAHASAKNLDSWQLLRKLNTLNQIA
jgi:hypothetical protein